MPIRFYCKKCDGKMKVPDDSAGKMAKCPRCGSLQPIPNATVTREDKEAAERKPKANGKPTKSVLEPGAFDPAEALAAFGGGPPAAFKGPEEETQEPAEQEVEAKDAADSKIIEMDDPQLAEEPTEAINEATATTEAVPDEPRPAAELEAPAEEVRGAPRPMIPGRKLPQPVPAKARFDPSSEIEILPDLHSGESTLPAVGDEVAPNPQTTEEEETPRAKPVAKAIRGSLTTKKGQNVPPAGRARPQVNVDAEEFVASGAAPADSVSIDLGVSEATDGDLPRVSKVSGRSLPRATATSESKGIPSLPSPAADTDTTLVAMAWLLRVLAALGLGVTAKLVLIAFDLGGQVPVNALVATVGGLILSAIPMGVAEGLLAINLIRKKIR